MFLLQNKKVVKKKVSLKQFIPPYNMQNVLYEFGTISSEILFHTEKGIKGNTNFNFETHYTEGPIT